MSSNKVPFQTTEPMKPWERRTYTLELARRQKIGMANQELLGPAEARACEDLWERGLKADVSVWYFNYLVDTEMWIEFDGDPARRPANLENQHIISTEFPSAKYAKYFHKRTREEFKARAEAAKRRAGVDDGRHAAESPRDHLRPSGDVYRANDQQASQHQDLIMSEPDNCSQPTISAKMPPAPSNNIGLGPPEQGDSRSVRRKKVMRLAKQKTPTVSDEAILRLANKRVCRDLWAKGFGTDVTGTYYNYLLDVDIWIHAGGKREDFRAQFIDPMFDSHCASAKYKKYVNSRPLKERKKKEKEWKKEEKEWEKMKEARRKNEALRKEAEQTEQTAHSAHESSTTGSLLPAPAEEDPESEDEDWESDQAEDGSMDEEDSEENDEEIEQPQDVVMAEAVMMPGRLAQPTIPEILAIEEEVQHHVGMPGYNYNTMLAALKEFAEDNPNGLRLSKQDIFLQSVKAWQRMYGEEGEAAVVLNAVIDAISMTMDL